MMGEIVDDRHAIDDRFHFQPPFDAGESAKRFLDRGQLDTLPRSQRRRGRCIQRVMFTRPSAA